MLQQRRQESEKTASVRDEQRHECAAEEQGRVVLAIHREE
jgi:hypothetical protein